MFSVNSIMREHLKAQKKFLVVCSASREYVKYFGECKDHIFYILRGDQWNLPISGLSDNIRIIKGEDLTIDSNINAVISVGSSEDFDIATRLSKDLRVPLIQVHTVGMKTYVIHPFSAGVQPRPFDIEADVHVSINKGISINSEPILKVDRSTGKKYMSGDNKISIEIPSIGLQDIVSSSVKDASITHINSYIVPTILKKFQEVLHEYSIEPYTINEPYNVSSFVETWVGDITLSLEIMQCGGVVFLPYSEESELIIQDRENGFLYRDFPELKASMEYLKKTPKCYEKISEQAKESSLDFICTKETFETSWNSVFQTLRQLSVATCDTSLLSNGYGGL